MKPVLLAFLAMVFVLALPRRASAQTSTCDGLQGDKRALAQALLGSLHPYDCCDETIQACLQKTPVCRLARRLAQDVCRRVAAGQSKADIERSMARRATTMTTARKVVIDTTQIESVGASGAKVQLAAYVCARCPYCSKLVPLLHQSVTQGALKDKARLHLRIFPIRSHAGSTEGGLALLASQKLGKFWPFLLHLYRNFDNFDVAKLPDCAASQGMNREEFIRHYEDASTRSLLTDSKKEGVRNKVDATPTVFLNGRPYTADLDIATLQDIAEEEHDRLSGRVHE